MHIGRKIWRHIVRNIGMLQPEVRNSPWAMRCLVFVLILWHTGIWHIPNVLYNCLYIEKTAGHGVVPPETRTRRWAFPYWTPCPYVWRHFHQCVCSWWTHGFHMCSCFDIRRQKNHLLRSMVSVFKCWLSSPGVSTQSFASMLALLYIYIHIYGGLHIYIYIYIHGVAGC